jgi:hypothetical protein
MRRKPLFPPPTSSSGRPQRNKGRQPYSVLTINGRLKLWRTRWHEAGAGSCTQADAWLDEAEATISQGVREMCSRLNQGSTSFRQAAINLGRTAHLDISAEALRQIVEADGKEVLRLFQRAQLSPEWTSQDCRTESGTTRVYEGCDGVKVPVVTDAEKKKRRATIRKKRQQRGRKAQPLPRLKAGADNAYKEFRVVHFYDQAMKHRFVQATSGNHEAAGRLMQRMSLSIDLPRAAEKVALIDGAPWIRNQIELHGVVNDIGLDFYHLRDYAQKTRRVVFGTPADATDEVPSEGKKWLEELMHTFRHAGYDAGWDRLTAWRSTLRKPAHRAAANSLLNYVAERRPLIKYPEFRNRGWHIGSGPTEAECKTTTHRIKGRGRRWDTDHAEALMALACMEDSGLWHRYWTTLDATRN